MPRKKLRGALGAWEQAMIDAYYDEQCHMALDPLFEKFLEWHDGLVTHADLDAGIHFVHREMQKIYSFFAQSRTQVAAQIVADRSWYERWLADNPMPDEE